VRDGAWPAVSGVTALSGFAALGYQIVWTQQFGVWLGHEIVAALAVVAAFFGGLAAGALVLGARVARSARPKRWYVALEAVIGGWALVLTGLMPIASAWMVSSIGEAPSSLWHWTVAFSGPFLLLLPATAAMGATLPAIERVFSRARHEGFAIGGLYAANTLGAVAGVLVAAFVLAPRIGLTATAVLCAASSLLCASIALWVLPDGTKPNRGAGRTRAPPRVPKASRTLMSLALTGFLGIGYEVAVVRVLSQVAENTVYTFALLLAVYLLGTSAGGATYQRWFAQSTDSLRMRAWLLATLVAACLTGTTALWGSEAIKAAALGLLGRSFETALLAEALLAVAAFALPTFAMGALFSHLCVEAKESGWSFGSGLAANTLGAAFAAPLVGVWLLPALGAKVTLLSLTLAYLVLLPRVAWSRVILAAPVSALVAAAVALLVWAPSLIFVSLPVGGKVLSHREGVMAAVSVVEDERGVRSLHINNREQEGSNATRFSDARQAWLALSLHPAPGSALLLGLGTGVTAAAAASDSSLSVDAVELLPEVIEAAAYFVPASTAAAPRVVLADARRYVRASTRQYDVIIADLFHPARSGSGSLYTVEHFTAVRERLAEGGLFCQWLPLHQLDLDSLRSIVRSFLIVYPEAIAVLATHSLDTPVIGLMARRERGPFAQSPLALHAQSDARHDARAELKLDDELEVLGSIVAGPRALAAFAGSAPPNTDDRAIVAHRAPRLAYAADSPRDRLLELLHGWHTDPAEVLGAASDDAAGSRHRRLAAYWQARTRYIEVGMAVHPSSDVHDMLAQVRGPLLSVLRISPDFRAAYDPLVGMAIALGRADPAGARELLHLLQDIQPLRPEAARTLQQLPEH